MEPVQILDAVSLAVSLATGGIASSTFVEYGYYADRPMLAAMAERAGGQLIHANSFAAYEPALEQEIAKEIHVVSRVEVDVPAHSIGGIAFEMKNTGELVAHDTSSGKALVGIDVYRLWYLSEKPDGGEGLQSGHDSSTYALYAAMSLFAVRARPDVIFPILKHLGDVRFIKMFANCFGKQAYSVFMDTARAAAFDPKLRCADGINYDLVPADDAFTIFDLLLLLNEEEGTRLLLDDNSFEYARITRAQLNADENLTVAEQAQVQSLTAEMSKERNAQKLGELRAKIEEITAGKRDALVFTPEIQVDGYEMDALVFNETSPNISVRVKRQGTIDLEKRILATGENTPGLQALPNVFSSFIYRNYAIVAHGIRHVDRLPVKISDGLRNRLIDAGVTLEKNERDVLCINLSSLPIINRKMVMSVRAEDAAGLAFEVLRKRVQKVYKDYKSRHPDDRMVAFRAKYGESAANG